MPNIILDASALLVLIKNDPGATIIEPFLGQIIMSSISVLEVAAVLLDSHMTRDECQQALQPLILSIVPFDEQQAFTVAGFIKQFKDTPISLGIQASVALSIKMQLPIYTSNKLLSQMSFDECKIVSIN